MEIINFIRPIWIFDHHYSRSAT